jgi:uncharacterized membrane protein YphA (DoxX/SURF4 family)
VAPLPLRLVLGVTFLWAGLGKIEGEFSVQGDTAATLASMGVERLREEGQRNLRATQPARPDAAKPDPAQTPTPAPAPAPAPPETMGPPRPEPEDTTPPPQPTPTPTPTPTQDPAPLSPNPPPPSAANLSAAFPAALPLLAQVTAPPTSPDSATTAPKQEIFYHAGLFPQPVSIKRLYRLSLLVFRAANPVSQAPAAASASPNSAPVAIASDQPRKLMPGAFARGVRPVVIAWMIAIGEVIAGSLLLMGLLTRFAAIFCGGLMLGAIWLTELGPAIQAGNTMLGFLPKRELWDPELWKTLFWQCSLLAACGALALTGSGFFGLDRRLFPEPPPAPSRPRPML